MPLETPARIVRALASRGFNAEREAVTLVAGSDAPDAALEAVVDAAPEDALVIEADLVERVLAETSFEDGANSTRADDAAAAGGSSHAVDDSTAADVAGSANATDPDPSVSSGDSPPETAEVTDAPGETTGSGPAGDAVSGTTAGGGAGSSRSSTQSPADSAAGGSTAQNDVGGSTGAGATGSAARSSVEIEGDITGESTGTGAYSDFVTLFRDRYDKLSRQLRGRVNHRPTDGIERMAGGSEAAIVGMVDEIRSTANGHWLVDLEDPNGTFPVLITKDRDIAEHVDVLLPDEVIAVEGTLADDSGILFVDDLYFPEVPRTYEPSTADRHVQAALISDVHVGSQEFMAEAWNRFADWLHTPEAEAVEYLLIAGDMVEGVGVYPDQDEELSIVDVYEQYETFAEHLKAVPGDLEIVMIPGNHDAVRLAEPQPAFDEDLREIMSAHDATITGNPSTVTVEGVSVLMYHGVSLDEMIAELPEEKASYDEPQKPMYELLRKRHVAPKYGGHMRLAPEKEDHLVIEDVPDVFHTGHVHKLGFGKYRNVLAINSGCWQAQTDFQESVNIDPDAGYAPIVDLDTLDVTVRKFS